MKWLPWIWQKEEGETDEALRNVQRRFARFLSLLDANNRVLKLFSDFEEKAQGDFLFDINYIRSTLAEIRDGVTQIIEGMIALGGDEYRGLQDRFSLVDAELTAILTGSRPVPPDDFTISFDQVDRGHGASVGSKNAQLGEIGSRLGLPVPAGFAITAWAYQRFLDANDLQRRIDQCVEGVDFKRYDDLVWISEKIQNLVLASKVPADLEEAIRRGVAQLQSRTGADRFALRSSAIGEDTQVSFAGQYRSLLNVRGEEVVRRYREVLAGKFTPKAIYYQLSHAFRESELAMCVGCISMVDAAASGVVYTRNPVRPADDCLLINAVFGLGQLLVNGTLTPDVFRVSRESGELVESQPARKAVRLVMRPDSGTVIEPIEQARQLDPSLGPDALMRLGRMAMRLEEHYEAPQDIEWALDREGRLFVLQSRPLKLVERPAASEEPDLSGLEAILFGGATVCPGAGCGPVCHASSSADLSGLPEGCVLIAPHPFPGLFAALGRIAALVTEVGGVASHMATLARECGIPTIMGASGAGRIPAGAMVTVDATHAAIYSGAHAQVVRARRRDGEAWKDNELLVQLKRLLAWVAPLNLLHPADPGFAVENCRTLHDITRFCHQKAMQEMLEGASGLGRRESIGLLLKSEIPLPVKVVYLDQDPADHQDKRSIGEDEVESEPMRAFWAGIKAEGWPLPRADVKGLALELGGDRAPERKSEFTEDSYAILGREYMIVSLRMGYHFSTIEAMCTDEPNKNFVGLQYKEGGAALDRRLRRLRLITRILEAMGFENLSKGDFLDSRVAYLSRDDALEKLRLIGRLTMMTKQLDMALSNDSITDWYVGDFMRRLGLVARPNGAGDPAGPPEQGGAA